MTKEVDISVVVEDWTVVSEIPSFIEDAETHDSVAESAQEITNLCYFIESLCERIHVNLMGITLTAKDDNTREIAQAVGDKFKALYNEFLWSLTESGSDWEGYSLSGVPNYFAKDGKQTLLIPHLREEFQSVVEKDFTEEMFQEHLAHIRNQFGLSEQFK